MIMSPSISPNSNDVNMMIMEAKCKHSNLRCELSHTDRNSIVAGVVLLHERGVGKMPDITDERNIILGAVRTEDKKLTVEELRRLLCSELPGIPSIFIFLTKEGWPVFREQECQIKAYHIINEKNVICIQKQFDKHRIGVVEFGSEPIGFVLADLNCNLRQLRESIEQQLKLSLLMKSSYRFIERNGWPVMLSQETLLSTVDIVLDYNIRIKNCDKLYIPAGNPRFVPDGVANSNRDLNHASQEIQETPATKKKVQLNRSEPCTSINKSIKGSQKKINKDKSIKPILISYVRAEAAKYALDLKRELVQMGFSVYLDVDEIKTGTDWQDDLNFAVTHCFMFVPLITNMYGKTQWTNREIKLADVLGKLIIPVNFKEHWPPGCLAIQFASTQYIPWKLAEGYYDEREKPHDSRIWDRGNVKRVSGQIADCFEENYQKWTSNTKVKPQHVLLSTREDSFSRLEPILEERKQLIVISGHPFERHLALELKDLLEKEGHEVWCSIFLKDPSDNQGPEDWNSTNPNTPYYDLALIPGGEVFFGPDEQNESDPFNPHARSKSSLSFKKDLEMMKKEQGKLLSLSESDGCNPGQGKCLNQEKLHRLSMFQQKVDQAGVVIVLISKAYTKSTFSQQQVFYCEHRKRVVLVKSDKSVIPRWFRLLMGNDIIMRLDNPQFDCVLMSRIKRALDPTTSETPKDATAEAKMNYLVNFLMKNLPLQDKCVYIVGSSKLQTPRSEEICRAIGRELAKMKNISIVTGGCHGAADITARTFYECKEMGGQFMQEDSSVVHILPMHDSEDLSSRFHQNPDGSFEAVPYGKTVFLGDSVKERETVAARLLDTCIVIEGGPGVVHEVEEFIWNDHFVIPIISTSGAAGGQYGVPVKVFQVPPGVEEQDWSILGETEASPQQVAQAVVNIMASLKKDLNSPASTPSKRTLWKRLSRKLSKDKNGILSSGFVDSSSSTTAGAVRSPSMRKTLENVSDHSECDTSDTTSDKKMKWWQRIF